MIKKRIRPNVLLLLQLEEAKIGDPERLKLIKKSLENGQPIPEIDHQYIEDLATQLQNAIEEQIMDDWDRDFTQKLQEKEKSFEQVQEPEIEKNTHKMDQKSLEITSTQLKQAIDHEKKIKWTLDLIERLRKAKVVDPDKIDHITRLLNDEKNIEESDKQYLKEKAQYLKQIADYKNKIMSTLDAIKKLQEVELRHSKRLEAIMHAIESGRQISERDIRYLNTKYEKLKRALEQQNKIDWTMSAIEKFAQFGIGNSEKIKIIKELLEDELPVPEEHVKHLKEKYKILAKIMRQRNKIEAVVEMIDELKEMEIGDYKRLDSIKKILDQRKSLPESEINYLAHKCRVYLIMKKLEKEDEPDFESKEFVNYKSLLNELNDSLRVLEKSHTKIS